jgi:dTDP-4-dehydrorhamnose reductase
MSSVIEIWAGVECTVNRVGDRFVNQCDLNGHRKRLDDLSLFQALGIQRLRYPFLWETVEIRPGEFDWSYSDERMKELRRLNLKPIAGLLHHGSGPSFTNLLDPEFPKRFAIFAGKLAERYPDIEDYTPINEPLTTARFSALYGHWYPHERDDRCFLKAFLNQIRASFLAIEAIRLVNPKARWIQTEDLGWTQGTLAMQSQVEFENNRRWLSFDFFCEKVDFSHPLWEYLCQHGLQAEEMDWLHEKSCSPDILGINHYLLSNRFLDERLQLYPPAFHGGNGRQAYADVGVIDTRAAQTPAPETVFLQAWKRYGKPLAITEVHLHGFREDQLRWLSQVHNAAKKIRAQGVDLRAITGWSLLGSFDWNSLCTKQDGYYESGIFDVRSPKPRPTLLAKALKTWAHGKPFRHPLLEQNGWWTTKDRSAFGPPVETLVATRSSEMQGPAYPLIITGAHGTLGRAFTRICTMRNIPFLSLSRRQLDITQSTSVLQTLRGLQPWAVVNAAGYVRVDDAETEKEKCLLENVQGPENLARACAQLNLPFLHFSSDLVFNGENGIPYTESDSVSPLSIYGQSKADSEKRVQEIWPQSLVIRASSFFGPWDEHNFIYKSLKQLLAGGDVYAAPDITISPTYIPDLVHLCLDLLLDGEKGVFHLTNDGQISWAGFAQLAADMAKHELPGLTGRVLERSATEMNYRAPRPRFSALTSERIRVMPGFDHALRRYFKELEVPFGLSKSLPKESHL